MASYKEILGKELYEKLVEKCKKEKVSTSEFLRRELKKILGTEKVGKTEKNEMLEGKVEKLENRIEELASRMGFVESEIEDLRREMLS